MQDLIKKRFNTEMDKLTAVWDEVNWNDRNVYANWIAQTYFYVCHSTRLLALTAANFSQDKSKLHMRFINHLGEEKGHEVMAIRDLKGLGLTIDKFEELPELSAFYQTQYYWIEHMNPISFLGYILCLEGLAVKRGAKLYEQLKTQYGEAATTFLKVHAAEDIEHLEKAFGLLDGLTENEIKIVFDNMQLSAALYASVLAKLGKISSSLKAA